MSKIKELINELCPDGVRFKRIDEICSISRGRVISKDYIRDNKGDYPVYSSQTENNGELGKISTYDFEGEFLTWTTDGANAGCVFYRNGKFSVTNVCGLISVKNEDLLSKYLYYILSIEAPKYVNKGMGNPKLMSNVMARIKVPVPPLEVQREIVRVLDSFTLLTAELTAELTARKKQYEYYREYLLNKNFHDVQKKKLGEIFEFRNGLSKGKDFFGKGIPFVKYTDVYNHRKLKKEDITALVDCTPEEMQKLKVSRGDVFFTRTSETAEDVGWSSVMLDNMEECVFNGFTIKATPKTTDLLPEYCAYCFSTDSFRKYVTSHCSFTTRASLTGKAIAEYEMPIPSHKIQKRIAETLDNFETICNDLNIGLPAEIEARKKQYEFYRDLLLTFAETGDIIAQTDRQTDRQTDKQ